MRIQKYAISGFTETDNGDFDRCPTKFEARPEEKIRTDKRALFFPHRVIHNVDNFGSGYLVLIINDLDKLCTLCGKIVLAHAKKDLLLSALRQEQSCRLRACSKTVLLCFGAGVCCNPKYVLF